MREVTVEKLREELGRNPSLLAQTRVLHPCGMRIHGPADVLTPPHVKAMVEAEIRHVYLLEPGESEAVCARNLATEMAEPGEVKAGDIVMEDLRAPDGSIRVPAKTKVDAAWLAVVGAHPTFVPIRKRSLDVDAAKARTYLSTAPPQAPKPPRVDTRVTQLTLKRDVTIKPLLAPRARMYLCLRDEFSRTAVVGTLRAEGHEALEFPDIPALRAALAQRPDVVLVDVADAPEICSAARQGGALVRAAVLVAAGEGQAKEVYKALTLGANGSLSLPARRDIVLEALHGALRVTGKFAKLKPAVKGERRRTSREPAQFACRVLDRFLSKPLPVETATVEDIHDRGLRLVYARPVWPLPWAYMAGSVHPKHFFFNYARVNPLGRELTLAFTGPTGAPLEVNASFVHVGMDGIYETAGLQVAGQKSVKQHMTTMRSRF